MQRWYAVQSKPRQEDVADANLVRQGFHVYLPKVLVRRRKRDKWVKVVEPLFPRYLFVHLSDQTDNWGPIRSTIGVANLVRFGMRAAHVPNSLIAMMRERDQEGVQTLTAPELAPGDQVRIVEGVMAGYEAIFQAQTSKERVVLLLQLAQDRTARIQVSAHDVEPVSRGW